MAALAVSAGMLAACATGAEPPADASGRELGAKYGACTSPPGEVSFTPTEYLAATADWLAVAKVVDAGRSTRAEGQTLPAVILDDSAHEQRVQIHTSFWPGVEWTLAHGGQVWFAMADPDLFPADMVDYVLAVTPSGEVFFPGSCIDDRISIPVHEALGADADAVLARLPRVEHADVRAHLGLAPLESDEEQPVILNPQDADPALLERLTPIAVRIHISEPVGDGSLTICSRITEGWNDCARADADAVDGTMISGYIGDDRVIEFWLMDDIADTSKPLAKLGTVTMPADAEVLDVHIETSAISDDGEVTGSNLVTLAG
ncbi:hypothetical protein [Microbacterium terricola]|uniref:Uncharacterized protein n=1 Tax=Microbacterium terricola TaxID=344163 RepID=A0ABM8E3F9_9MICO|nr:hypothetical protein [Microbacterium terricola]UYK39992.1 hypothetical protein OAU46_15090 [Microbacterium terricola]BDV32319.1 hypothetical protein Microterr_29790 [Microbacterium terricola]